MNLFLEISYFAGWTVLLLVLLAGLWRLSIGPTTLDRMVGFDTLTIAVVGIIALFSIHEQTGEYLELILVVAALGFFSTVAYFYYLLQPKHRGSEDFNREDRV